MIGLSPDSIARAGMLAVAAIIFAESGLMIGFFLPGDSLLFTAGFLASQGILDIHSLVLLCFIAAVLGDSVGYAFGTRVGPQLLKRPDGRIFKKRYIAEAQAFYEVHGKKTIILARFTPIVRTFAPIVAGVGEMHYRTFIAYNIIGGALWTLALTYGGYFLGSAIPGVEKYLEPMILLIVLLSLSPAIYHYFKVPEHRKKAAQLPAVTYERVKRIFTRNTKKS